MGEPARTFPDFSVEVVEVRDRDDLTFASLRYRGRGAGSDVPIEQTLWLAGEWRDKKVIWWRVCATEAEAVEAAGLRE